MIDKNKFYFFLMTRVTFGLCATTHDVATSDKTNHTANTKNNLLLKDCAICSSFATYSIFMVTAPHLAFFFIRP